MLRMLKRRLVGGLASSLADGRFANVRLVKMSDGHLALIRELGLVKGGRGLRHHERLISFSARAAAAAAMSLISGQRSPLADTSSDGAREAQV